MPYAVPSLRSAHLFAALLLTLSGCSQLPRPVEVNIAAVNDFHGNLAATPFRYPDAAAPGGHVTVKAGGIEALSGAVDELRRQDPQLLLIGAGDLVGGSPLMSAMWADEPTLQAFGLMGLKFSVVGNHELDLGKAELQRQINGGCASSRPDKACRFSEQYPGKYFPYLASNLMDSQTGKPLFPAYRIEEAKGAKIAFVGAVLRDLPEFVSKQSMEGLYTIDEADAINAQLPELRKQGVDAVVAVIHQGGETDERFDQPGCSHLSGDIVEVTQRLAPEIKVVVSAHTHQGYLCNVGDKLVTQGSSAGRLLTHITLNVDPVKHQLLSAKAQNLVVDANRYRASPSIASLQAAVEARSRASLEKPVARLGVREIRRTLNEAGESAMGNLVADAQLHATRALGAQVAFMNLGGIRADVMLEPGQDRLLYGQVASVQPFNNTLSIVTLTGRQIRQLLEEQWRSSGSAFYPLQPSASLTYSWNPEMPQGQRIVPDSLRIDGKPVRPDQDYRVTVNSFMSSGGDNFSTFAQGTHRLDTGLNDVQALVDYLQFRDQSGQPVGQGPSAPRIKKVAMAPASVQP